MQFYVSLGKWVCRGVSITTLLQYYFYGLLLTIDTLYREASIDAADFLNIRENILNVIVGGELWPSYRETPMHAVNVFYNEKFPITKKVDFPRNFEIQFPVSGPRFSYQNFFPHGPWASPYNESKNLAPTPENLAKMGCKFFWGWSPSGGLWEIL